MEQNQGLYGPQASFKAVPGCWQATVQLEGDAAQNAYEVATLPGGTDINSLLGHDGGPHHT